LGRRLKKPAFGELFGVSTEQKPPLHAELRYAV